MKKRILLISSLLSIVIILVYGVNKYIEANRIPKLEVYTTENGKTEIKTYTNDSNIIKLNTTSNIIDTNHDEKVAYFGTSIEHNGEDIDFKQSRNCIVLPEEKGIYKIKINYCLDEKIYKYIFEVNLK